MARAMSIFFSWAVVKPRQISRTIKKNYENCDNMHCLMTSLRMFALFISKVATLTQSNSLSAYLNIYISV